MLNPDGPVPVRLGEAKRDHEFNVLIGNNGGVPLLLRNNAGAGSHWLGLKLEGVKCNRDAIGAKIRWSANSVIRARLKNAGEAA